MRNIERASGSRRHPCAWRLLIALAAITVPATQAMAEDGEGPSTTAASDDHPAQPAAAEHVVYLHAEPHQTDQLDWFGNLLLRELARQSVLMAARDELHAVTRDEALREPPPSAGTAGVTQVHVTTRGTEDKQLQVELYLQQDDEKDVLWEGQFPLTADAYEFYLPLTVAMEKASRDEFARALAQAGLAQPPDDEPQNSDDNSAPLPAAIERALVEFHAVSQFSAVRQLHERIREAGESPELLAALVRGYAHLGLLTYHHWNASSKVFFARSLLYAERLVARQPESADPLFARAYARSLAGLHAAALADLEKAAELLGDDATPDMPVWARAAELYARYDFQGLSELAGEDAQYAETATCLSFIALAAGGGDDNVIEAGETTIKASPECYRVYDLLCDFGGVSHLHSATLHGPATLVEKLPPRVARLPGIPEAIKRAVQDASAGDEDGGFNVFGGSDPFERMPTPLVDSLVEAGGVDKDAGELSWSVLGRLVEEEIFQQAVRRIRFFKRSLGLPVEQIEEYLLTVAPHYVDHPYAPWLASLGVNPLADREAYRELLDKVKLGDLVWSHMPYVGDVSAMSQEDNDELWLRTRDGLDLIAYDREELIKRYRPLDRDRTYQWGHQILRVSPHSPQVINAHIESTVSTLEEMRAWEEEYGQHVIVLSGLSKRLAEMGEFADAERTAKKWMEISADKAAYEQLAIAYQAQGKDKEWLQTMHAYLDEPDYALGHAWFRVKIAEYYMSLREWEQALPYAEEAAPTGASFAMHSASKVHEALGNWEESEEWSRSDSLRYDIIRHRWYFWCRRTGRGNLDEARRLALTGVNDFHTQNPPQLWDWVGCFYLMDGDREKAYEVFLEEYHKTWTYWNGLFVALLADELDKVDIRDNVLQFMVDNTQERYQEYPLKKYCELLQAAYAAEKKLDLAAVDKLMEAADEANRCDMAYYTGHFLAAQSDDEAAVDYFRRCYESWELDRFTRTVASVELQNRDMALDPVAELVQPAEEE